MDLEKLPTFGSFTQAEWAAAFMRVWDKENAERMSHEIMIGSANSNGFGLSPYSLALLSLVNPECAAKVERVLQAIALPSYTEAVLRERGELLKGEIGDP